MTVRLADWSWGDASAEKVLADFKSIYENLVVEVPHPRLVACPSCFRMGCVGRRWCALRQELYLQTIGEKR